VVRSRRVGRPTVEEWLARRQNRRPCVRADGTPATPARSVMGDKPATRRVCGPRVEWPKICRRSPARRGGEPPERRAVSS
jgi:hypothetical protein